MAVDGVDKKMIFRLQVPLFTFYVHRIDNLILSNYLIFNILKKISTSHLLVLSTRDDTRLSVNNHP